MFCPKCGNEVEQGAMFCPKCGNMLMPQEPVDLTKSMSDSVGSVQNSGNGYGAQPVQQPYQPVQPPVGKHVEPKKSKAPLIAAIIALIVVALGVAGFCMRSTLAMIINPEEQVKEALKNSAGNLQTSFDTVMSDSSLASTQVVGKNDFTYSLHIDRATVNGSDYLSYVKADTLNMHLQMSPEDKVIAGTMGLAQGTGKSSVIEMKIYMDTNNVYFSIPALCSKSFYMKTDDVFRDSGISYSDMFSYMGKAASTSNISAYSGIIQAVVKDVFGAVDSFIDELSYDKLGRVTFNGEQGDVKATQFAITVTEQNVRNFANNVIENVFNDDTLKPYLAFVSGYVTKDTCKNAVTNAELGFGQFVVNAAITNKKELVSVSFDTNSITTYKGSAFKAELKLLGREKKNDCIYVNIGSDELDMDAMASSSGDNIKIDVKVTPKSGNISNQYLRLYMDAAMKGMDASSGSLVINSLTLDGNIDGTSLDVAMSGSADYKQISSLDFRSSDFANAINASRMTASQENEVSSEVIKNISVLKNVLSDDMYNNIYRQMFGSSSIKSFY